MVNPYQEMGKCPKCNSTNHVFLDGYNMLNTFNVILKCECSHVWTKVINTEAWNEDEKKCTKTIGIT